MAPIPGGVRVTGFVSPSDSGDTYATHKDIYGYGGYRPVANAAARLAITADRREVGMLVKQLDTGEYWTLQGGILDANWVIDPLGVGAVMMFLSGITGNIFFVDTAGNDANPGTYALPFLTIDHAIGACVSNHNDAIVVTDSLGAGYDENVNVDGIELDVNTTTALGVGLPYVDNTNGGATYIFNVTGTKCKVLGFSIAPCATASLRSPTYANEIGNEEYPNVFNGGLGTPDIILDGQLHKVHYNRHLAAFNAVEVRGHDNEVHDEQITGDGGAGSIGIYASAVGPSNKNFIHDNRINSVETGIQAGVGAHHTLIANNDIQATVAPIVELNNNTTNTWTGNRANSVFGTHTVHIADGTVNTQIVTLQAWRAGRIELQMVNNGFNALGPNDLGKIATMSMITNSMVGGGTGNLVDHKIYTLGVDRVMPKLGAYVNGGDQVTFYIQMETAISVNTNAEYQVYMEG